MRASWRARLPSCGSIPMTLPRIDRVEAGHVLTRAEAEAAMEELLSGRVETPEIVRLLAALNRRPIEVQELAGFASVMRRHATRVFADGEARPAKMVDTCATCGSGAKTNWHAHHLQFAGATYESCESTIASSGRFFAICDRRGGGNPLR